MSHINKNKLSISVLSVFTIVLSAMVYISLFDTNASKAELAYIEHSPLGGSGGSVMPASCDSYPDHSTCECALGQTRTVACNVANGTGIKNQACIATGDNRIWNLGGACYNLVCDPGYDHVLDHMGRRCEPNCTGNGYRVYVEVLDEECDWKGICKSVKKKESSCAPCADGLIPNANHTACVVASSPTVNVNLGN